MLGLGNLLTKGGVIQKFPNEYSFNFDGSNDYLSCGTGLGNQLGNSYSGDITVSMWIKCDVTSGDDGLFYMGASAFTGAYGEFQILISSSNRIKLMVNGNAWSTHITTTDTEWKHLCVVYKGNSAKENTIMYLNGEAQTQTGTTDSNTPSSLDFSGLGTFIGAYYGTTNYTFNGNIDEVGIWNTALDATAVAKIASKPLDLTKHSASNLKLWLRAGDKVLPEEDTSIARSDFYTAFDGGSEYVDCGLIDIPVHTNATMACWVKLDDFDATQFFGGSHNSKRWYFGITDGKKPYFGVADAYKSNGSALTINAGEWNHFALVADGGTATFYMNGIAKDTDTYTQASATNPDNPFLIGARNDGGTGAVSAVSPLDGNISSVKLYKTALDAQTIKQFAKSRFTPMRDNRFSVVDFDGTNPVIAMTTSSAVSPTEAITVSAWVNFTSLEDYDLVVGNTDTGSNGWRLAMDNADNIIFAINSWGSNHAETPMSSTGVWHHLVGTYDKSNIKIYLDGELKGTDSYTDSITYSSNVFQIGGASGWSNLTGSISSVAIYSDAKDADFIYAQYQKGITHNPSADTGLVGLWRMGDDTSKAYPTIADSSSNSNDGTMTSMASDDIVQQMVAGYDMGAYDNSTEELGGEIVNDPTFSTDLANGGTNANFKLNGNGEITNGGWLFTAGGGLGRNTIMSDASTEATFLSSQLYKIVFTISSSGSANINFEWANISYPAYGNGEHTIYAYGDGANLQWTASAFSATFSITAFSIKPVLQSDLSDTHPAIIDVANPTLGAELAPTSWTGVNATTSESTDYAFSGTTSRKFTTTSTDGYIVGSSTFNTTISKLYKLNFMVYSPSDTDIRVKIIRGGGSGWNMDETITIASGKWVNIIRYVLILGGGASSNIYFQQGTNGVTQYLDDISFKEVKGNVGTMTSMATDNLTYSSVLPDQSFLVGNSSPYNFLDLDGVDAKVTLSSQQSLTGDFTISGWMNRADEDLKVFFGDSNSGTKLNYLFITQTTKDLAIDFQGLTAIEFSNSNPPHSEWFHFAITRNAKIFKCYVNGSLTDTEDKSSAGAYDQTWTYNQIGTYFSGSYWIDASFSNFAIHNKELIASEISAIHTAGRHTNLLDSYSDNLKNYYAFGALDAITGLADTDSTIYDRSGNSVHGTTSGSATGDLKSPPNANPSSGYSKGDTNRSTDVK